MNQNEEAKDLHTCVEKSMNKLTGIWDQIGIVGEPREARRGVVLHHIRSLLDEMIKEEEVLRDKLIANVEKFSTEVHQLCTDLSLPEFKVPDSISVLLAEKELKSKVESLTKEKQDRMKKLKTLMKEDENLSSELTTVPFHILMSVVPTTKQLEDLQQHLDDLIQEKKKRQSKFCDLQEKIINLLGCLSLSPNTSFQRNVVMEGETILMSIDNIHSTEKYLNELEQLLQENKTEIESLWKRIHQLWNKLEIPEEEKEKLKKENDGVSQLVIVSLTEELSKLEELKLKNVSRFIQETRKELIEIWDLCYVPQATRDLFLPFYQDEMSEELLFKHEEEVKKMNNYYHDNHVMIQLVAKRQKLWKEFLELEKRASNPDRFFNRGCNLLKEEKQRKKVNIELPKVEQEVIQKINQWESENGKRFLIGGEIFEEFIARQKEEYQAEKENEKQARHQQKEKQMQEELLFGSKPLTPAKRFALTPTKTPNKTRKLETPTPSSSRIMEKFKKPFPSPAGSASKARIHTQTGSKKNLLSSATLERAISCQSLSTNQSQQIGKKFIKLNQQNKQQNQFIKQGQGQHLTQFKQDQGQNLAQFKQDQVQNLASLKQGQGQHLTQLKVGQGQIISTSIVASCSEMDLTQASLYPVGHYQEFANGLNKMNKHNTRSTLAPKPQH